MTAKDDFTAEEWASLLRAPIAAGCLVVAADPTSSGVTAELRAMARSIRRTEAAGAGYRLVDAVVADMTDADRPADVGAALADDPEALAAEVREAARIVDARTEPGVADGYKVWVRSVAHAAAEAAKEGSFLGIGGTRVSPEEAATLERIDELLDLEVDD